MSESNNQTPPVNDKPSGDQPSGDESAKAQFDDKSTDTKTTDNPSTDKPVDTKSEDKPVDTKSEDKPEGDKPASTPVKPIPAAEPSPTTVDAKDAVLKTSPVTVTRAKPVPARPSVPVTSIQATQAKKHLDTLNELLQTYHSQLSVKPGTTRSFQVAAKTLGSVIVRMLNTPTNDMMTAMWGFFVEHKNDILQESAALQGIEALDTTTRMRVELTYTLFRQAVNGVDVGNPKKVNMAIVQSRLKCPQLIPFLQAKANVVSTLAAQKAAGTTAKK